MTRSPLNFVLANTRNFDNQISRDAFADLPKKGVRPLTTRIQRIGLAQRTWVRPRFWAKPAFAHGLVDKDRGTHASTAHKIMLLRVRSS